ASAGGGGVVMSGPAPLRIDLRSAIECSTDGGAEVLCSGHPDNLDEAPELCGGEGAFDRLGCVGPTRIGKDDPLGHPALLTQSHQGVLQVASIGSNNYRGYAHLTHAIGRSHRLALELATLPIRKATPNTEPFIVHQCILQAFCDS